MAVFKNRLKDGRTVLIKELGIEDKEKLVEMYESLSGDAVRWAMPPYTAERIERWLSNLQNLISLVAFYDDKIVGDAHIHKLPHPRRKDTGDMAIYLHQDFHNVGLGTVMVTKLIELARKEGLHRIGLSVIADNKPAIRLYKKLGFKIEGVMKDTYFGEDAKYHDELIMGLILK
ncbi:MAG: GNAT family N-acetyltransferase [Candidatus Bathyarchaeota archaeon]|nr:GNAT family N-acetyltransferase [Candidatus Bathyarchaeota archaeon]MDH5787858.1 GNAT family N-acetyltransferase [Candidatus Bathyarchaeota archaeon]